MEAARLLEQVIEVGEVTSAEIVLMAGRSQLLHAVLADRFQQPISRWKDVCAVGSSYDGLGLKHHQRLAHEPRDEVREIVAIPTDSTRVCLGPGAGEHGKVRQQAAFGVGEELE